jgi:hypothetical protein
MKLAALGMAGGTAALLLAGAPALASSHATSKITGPESAYGVVHGKPATANNPTIPVVWRGLVNANGVFSTGGAGPPKKGQHHTFTTSAGNLTVVVTAKPTSSQTFSSRTCHFTFTTDVVFAALGSKSTGKFARASGPGAVEVYGAGFVPRLKSGPNKGKCNTSPNAPELAKGAVASFLLSAVLTTP